jgi:hypothetical protein
LARRLALNNPIEAYLQEKKRRGNAGENTSGDPIDESENAYAAESNTRAAFIITSQHNQQVDEMHGKSALGRQLVDRAIGDDYLKRGVGFVTHLSIN